MLLSLESRPLFLLALFIGLCHCDAVSAATPAVTRPYVQEAAAGITQSQIDAAKERAQKAQLDETKKSKVDASHAVAEANVARILTAREKTKTNRDLAANAEERVQELKKSTQKLADEQSAAAVIAQDAVAEALKVTKAELVTSETKLKDFQGLNAQRTEVASTFSQTLANLAQQQAELNEQLKAAPAADENPILLEARKLELQSGVEWTEAESARIESQSALFDAEQKAGFAGASIEFWTLKVKRTQQQANELETRLTEQRNQDTARAVADTQAEANKAPPLLKPFADANADIAKLATDILKPAFDAKNDLTKETARLTKIQQQFAATVNRVDAVGETASVGAYLRNRKSEIPREGWLSPLAAQRTEDIEHYQSEQFDLKEQLATLIADNVVEEVLVNAKQENRSLSAAEAEELTEAAVGLVDRRKVLLQQAIDNHAAYLDSLTKLKQTENALAATTSQFHEYINERILWIRSNDVLFTKMSQDKSDSVILSPSSWINAGSALVKDLTKNVLLTSLAGLIFIGLFAYRFKLRQRVKETAALVTRGTNTDFLPTLRTLVLTAAIAAPLPIALGFLGWRMGLASSAVPLAIAIGKALMHAGWFFFAAEFLRQVCRQDGLAEKHFGWRTATVAKLKRELNWFVPMGALFSFACSIFYLVDINHESDTIERVVFLAAIGSFTLFLSRILHPVSGMFREQIAQNPKAWFSQCSPVVFWSVVFVPVVLMMMVIVGYYYSAIQMLSRIFATVIAVVAFEIVRSLLTRFIMLSRRKARIEQARAKLLARKSEEASDVEGNAQAAELHRVADQEAFLAEATATIDDNVVRSQKLIVAAVAIAWLVSISIIWADVFPALRGLDKYALWTTTVETVVAESDSAGPNMPMMSPMASQALKADKKVDGNGSKASAEANSESAALVDGQKVLRETKVVSLRHLLMAILILAMSIFAVRNVPAFLELVLLKHLPVEQSIRHAVKAIVGYLILLLGVVAAGRAMYIGWSQIQWLATALTFGLAFGLQEIFANFIAGIILLLERPIRIGDVISVDEITGTVSKIRIRATTITNFDRKEYVVPNKEFITGRVLNWTLTDKVNRMTVRVGVAYGSDVRLAKKLVMDICQNHPSVVELPPTIVTFEEFGDSTLNITARTFLKDFESRWPALDDINLAIDDAFKSAGIEIAFPQRDLHIRTTSPDFERSVRNTMQDRQLNVASTSDVENGLRENPEISVGLAKD